MKIHYKKASLERECKELDKARKKYGSNVAEKLFSAIEFIEAAENLIDVREYPPFHLHFLKNYKKGIYAIDLGRKLGFRLLVRPLNSDGSICDNVLIYSAAAIEIVDIFIEEVSNHYE